MFVNDFVKKANLPPERVDGQPEAKETDSILVAAIRRTGIPITVSDFEVGVNKDPLKAAQPRHSSGKFSVSGDKASSKDQHEAAANFHAGKEGSKHAEAAQAHRAAASAHERNSPIASAYTEAAQQASQVANNA